MKKKEPKPKKEKIKPTDGLGPYEIAKLRSALRQCWQRSKARKEAMKRCTRADGHLYCEMCNAMKPQKQFKIDHIVAVGLMDEGHIARLFCPSSGLMGLCDTCHKEKTKAERYRLKSTNSAD